MLQNRCVAALIVVAACGGAQAATSFSFSSVTTNGATSAAAGRAQFGMDLSDVGGGVVEFLLRNVGPEASSIARVYVDDQGGSLGALSALLPGPGVDFQVGASPANLPGGSNIAFTADFAFGARNPAPHRGVNPGEHLAIRFALAPSTTYADLLDAMQTGALRVGLHAIAFDNGQSEAFVNDGTDTPTIPLPAASAMGFAGLALVGLRRRR